MFRFFPGQNDAFSGTYRCYPVSFIERNDLEFGDKVVLPPSALHQLAQMEVEYPMMFEVENRREGRKSHCGVIEFIADEGMVYLPYWMMQNLLLTEGSIVTLRNVSLPKGKYVKIQPHTKDFLDISDPKAVLERSLRNYSCLTVGDSILIHYNNKRFHIDIIDAKPQKAISIIETDCEVDFAPPLDYEEPPRPAPQPAAAPSIVAPPRLGAAGEKAEAQPEEAPAEPPKPSFNAFSGSARRLDGKPAVTNPNPAPAAVPASAASAAASRAAAGASTAGPSSQAPAAAAAQPAAPAQPGMKSGKLVFGSSRGVAAAAGGAPAAGAARGADPAAAAKKAEEEKKKKEEEEADRFKAFSGKAYKLG